MAPSSIRRRSMLVALFTVCGQFFGCRKTSRMPLHTWTRDPFDECSAAAVPTIVLPTLGEGPWDLRRDFQRALSSHLQKVKLMKIVEGEQSTVGTGCDCAPSLMTWDEQFQMLGNTSAIQAVVSKVTYLRPMAPVKLGIVVELKDVATRETLRQVQGLWDAPRCHPPSQRKKIRCRVAEPPWSDDLLKISPRHLLEQAAWEISQDIQTTDVGGQVQVTCAKEAEQSLAP